MARSNARLEVSGAGKTEDGLVQYNEEVNKLGDDLRELYETIRVNVDEEEQWKVFDFVEDFFMEELEIGDYINDINSYHLHMFDKHDVTTKKFDAIVEKAGKVDANYAAQIEGYCSLLGEYGKKFEAVCAMFALDLIGVKVFGYSDETAEAVASGEKLLKESQTVYESFADMMSPEDAKRYLDFLENGSREGLTSAELAGVEKADALLVSQKVGYEDVWDLRNVGDALESGRKGGSVPGVYTDKIKWGIHEIDVRPDGNGFWGQRIRQNNPRVDGYELKINPQNESYYLPHPEGGYVQFENMINSTVQDGKLVMQQKSFYHVNDMPDFAKNKVLEEARRQIDAAGAADYKVEWLVSDESAVNQLTEFFKEHNVDIIVTFYPE